MAGKISDAEKNCKIGNKVNSNMVKISSSKSILSYQNGSELNIENREETRDEGMPGDGYSEETAKLREPFSEDQSPKSDCLDLLRKKLISDLSLTVFSPDLENKLAKMEPIEISKERQSVIQKLLVEISQLTDAEKLLLYLKLPSSTSSPFDPLRQPLNPLGNRQEIQQTIVWIKTHLEEDSEISIPKQDVYDQYLKYCENVSMKPLSTADFGKVMKQVYPGVRPRRLGTRGNSRYCYSGMRNMCKLPTPILPLTSAQNPASNGSPTDSSSLSAATNKCKKLDKTKRKLKSSACRSEKCTTFTHFCSGSEEDPNSKTKNIKRSKVEDKECEVADSKESENVAIIQKNGEAVKKDVELSGIKCEEGSNNSFNTFEIECELKNDFGIYVKNVENVTQDPHTKSTLISDSPPDVENEVKQNEFPKMVFDGNNTSQMLAVEQNSKSCSVGNLFSSANSNHTEKSNAVHNYVRGKISRLDGVKSSGSDQKRPAKSRVRRSTSFSKPLKNTRKCYVPIQPKPVDIHKFNIRFEQPFGFNQFSSDQNHESGLQLCEESDSQEPEEEIVRYFKHLDENEINTDSLVDQAVKNMNNIAVQNCSLPQIISKNSASCRKNSDVLNHPTQQVLRSQSCFEVQRQLFNLSESTEPVHFPRSQSSVELPVSGELLNRETRGSGSGSGPDTPAKTKKVSHLRILLEKSMSNGTKIPYSNLKESSNLFPINSPVISTADVTSSISRVPSEPNCLPSPEKLLERDFLKLNGLKILSSSASYVPQSPVNRTKYFSFTPISPGPQSPLKTPSTPSASPFVSPRNTPVLRSRQNSSNDFFISPSERKSASLRTDCPKSEFINENEFNFSKTLNGNFRLEKKKQLPYLQACRPRSVSSTNFCRSKAQKNSSKLFGFDVTMNAVPNSVQTVSQNNVSLNSQFSVHKNFVSSECLLNEVRKFLEDNSTLTDDRSSIIRSQSVPLSRMISESSWIPSQVSSVCSDYFSSESSNPTLTPMSRKFPEWTSNSETNSPKDITTNVSLFLDNGEINNMESGPLNNEVFSEDPTIAQLDQYFTGDFRSSNEENFSKSDPFNEDSAFSSKLDLSSGGTFDSPFTGEPDPAMADNIKSFLPDFEGLENKSGDNCEGGLSEEKLIKTPLYERGNVNLKDPVISSFKPVIMNDVSSCSGSPVLSFFGNKMNEDNQQLIEFFDFDG